MGSLLEFNDTLQLTERQGFPADVLDLDAHRRAPVTAAALAGRVFAFTEKEGARYFHLDPVRVYLVENRDGKRIFWGKAMVQSLAIGRNGAGGWSTSGTFTIAEVFAPDYQRLFTIGESPKGKSWFAE
jgi:hypothetical protein